MLEGHLHDREQGQQHLIQFVKLVYYSPALFFTWSINYSQYVQSKNTVHRKKKYVYRPADRNASAVYNGSSIYRRLLLVHQPGPNDVIHMNKRAHTHTPLFRQFTKGYTPQNTRLARSQQKKGLHDATTYNLVIHAFLHTKTTTRCNGF